MPPIGRRTTCGLPAELQPPPSESSSSSDDDDADVPPPEIITAPTAKLLESLSRMVRSRWGTLRRHNPELQYPLELLDGSDVSWTVRLPTERHARHGRLNLPHLAEPDAHAHSGDNSRSTMIDSPRSVVVLLRNGFSADNMRSDPTDELTSARRFKTVQTLVPEYAALCRDVSSAFVVSVLRGDVDPMNHVPTATAGGGSEAASSPGSPVARSPRAAFGAPGTSPRGGSESPLKHSPSRCKPQDLRRLQRHRSTFTTEWGAKQQAIATETFNVQRVSQLVSQHKSEVRERAHRLLVGGGSPLGTAAVASAQDTSRSRDEVSAATPRRNPRHDTAASTPTPKPSPTVPCPEVRRAETPSTRPGTSTASVSRMAQVREMSRAIEERRRRQVEADLAAKEHRAEEAAKKKREERQTAQRVQRARAREAQDVVKRMERAADVRRLQVIKSVEEDAEARARRREEMARNRRERQLATKMRTTLQHRTRSFVEKAATAVEKATALQEMAVTAPVEQQRALKAESRLKLLKLLGEEDKLLRTWSTFEQRSEAGTLSQTSPQRLISPSRSPMAPFLPPPDSPTNAS